MHALPLTSNPSPSQIAINGYSPLGVPDFHKYGPTIGTPTLLEEETIKLIALTKGVTPAQVVLNWEWMNGVLINPRVYNTTHMCAPAARDHLTTPDQLPHGGVHAVCPFVLPHAWRLSAGVRTWTSSRSS